MVTLAISDVPGDDPAVIGSGPTVPDPSTLFDAQQIVARYGLELPHSVERALADPANETPKPGDPVFAAAEFRLVARPADAFRAAEAAVRAAGYECVAEAVGWRWRFHGIVEEQIAVGLLTESRIPVVVTSVGPVTEEAAPSGRALQT